MTPYEIAQKLFAIAEDRKAKDVRLLEITDLTVLADYFLICTANSTTHIKTMADEMALRLKELGEPARNIEGHGKNVWLLLDFGCVVVHLFLPEAREFYSLDRVWADAKLVSH
ncbi:MAG: ribosome silencing factor [Oscillospiraceae bacterium]|nr:ribosome silencing factor [Oscillospiraceae bacterium]